MKAKGVRVTKTGRALLLVGGNAPHERDRQIAAMCASVDAVLTKTETTLGIASEPTYRYASSPPLTPESFAEGLRLLKHNMEHPQPPRTELLTPLQLRDREVQQAFADADAVLATMNFRGVKSRAMTPCTCKTPKDRACASCLARDTILRSRGDYR